MHAISKGQLERINSLSTDTSDTMFSIHRRLAQYPELKHIFFIPCDSHGLQLLIKNVLGLPSFKAILEKGQKIAKVFKKSPLQLARLRVLQQEIYGQHRSLCLSVITRWGTQYRLVESVLNSKDALRRFATTFHGEKLNKATSQACQFIDDLDLAFWPALERLRELLQPLDEAVRMSESDKSHLGHVIHRWDTIKQHLTAFSRYYPELADFMKPDGAFADRYGRQVHSIHVAARYLNPINRQLNHELHTNPLYREALFEFFARYSASPEDAKQLRVEYIYFINQYNIFNQNEPCWEHQDDPKEFWLIASLSSKYLAPLCLRIFNAPCNSVSSERAFPIQNLIHSKLRNKLQPAKIDKLTFIYMNSRVLKSDFKNAASNTSRSSPYDLSEEQLVQMEDELFSDEESKEKEGIEEDFDDFNIPRLDT